MKERILLNQQTQREVSFAVSQECKCFERVLRKIYQKLCTCESNDRRRGRVYLLFVFLRLRHQRSYDFNFAQVLERSCRVWELQIDFLRAVQLQLCETELCGSHEIVLQTPIVVKALQKGSEWVNRFKAKLIGFTLTLIGGKGSSIGQVNVSSHNGFNSLCTVRLLKSNRPPCLNFTYGSLVPLLSMAVRLCPLTKCTFNWKNECWRRRASRRRSASSLCNEGNY